MDRNAEQDTGSKSLTKALRTACAAEGLEVGVHAFSQYAKVSIGTSKNKDCLLNVALGPLYIHKEGIGNRKEKGEGVGN